MLEAGISSHLIYLAEGDQPKRERAKNTYHVELEKVIRINEIEHYGKWL